MIMPADHRQPEPSELIRQCVRGLRPWDALAAIGIAIEQSGERVVYSNPNGHVVAVFPEDVAEGLTRLHGDSTRLQEWAEILLGGSSFVELRLENHSYGEALLEALWEASAGEPVRQSAVLAARELYAR